MKLEYFVYSKHCKPESLRIKDGILNWNNIGKISKISSLKHLTFNNIQSGDNRICLDKFNFMDLFFKKKQNLNTLTIIEGERNVNQLYNAIYSKIIQDSTIHHLKIKGLYRMPTTLEFWKIRESINISTHSYYDNDQFKAYIKKFDSYKSVKEITLNESKLK